MTSSSFLFLHLLVMFYLAGMSLSDLSDDFYDDVCPEALPTIKRAVEDAVRQERRMGASLLRLHFHDCFVNGCDASVLLDQTSTIDSGKTSRANNNFARGFEVIDRIKSKVDKICGRPVVSCADILAVAARDSLVALHGPTWEVLLGRRDSTTASRTSANNDIPTPLMDLPALIDNFKKQGLDEEDLVALSGGHTLEFDQCFTFRIHIYNETNNIDSTFASQRLANCPRSGGDSNLASLDPTPALFDSKYFSNLVSTKGLLHSDQALFSGGETDELIKTYSTNLGTFSKAFADSMIKMGNMKPLTGNQGQIRVDCRRVSQ
ncbi:peroxidase 2-like [Capsicum annuum]|uniref:peroxidase 2-like n=1 Tax=Capsicum annuum TaxID=4072 RepID=UPI001FB1646A|nr:peroxidase 2-like [Capsicum annuum]